MMKEKSDPYFHSFEQDITHIDIPQRLNFPFAYTPHPLAITACKQVQKYLQRQEDFTHNFGLPPTTDDSKAIGKMFGILVVKDKNGDIGFLSAFSGKLAESNTHIYFVPPVYDLLKPDSFFLQEEEVINGINARIKSLEADPNYLHLKAKLTLMQARIETELHDFRQKMKKSKLARKEKRQTEKPLLSESGYKILLEDLIKQSYRDQYEFKLFKNNNLNKISDLKSLLSHYQDEISDLKSLRKEKSSILQKKIFEQYNFLNIHKDSKTLYSIFKEGLNITPPSGAGECAAPKLFQYAFTNELKPIALAEFWWGAPPNSEVRKHKNYYPCCKGKCEPILQHMLDGIPMDPNPMLTPPRFESIPYEIIYEDEALLAVDKAPEFLSVPGIHIKDSVQERIKSLFPEATQPLLLHRLDMPTSGVLLFAKTKEAHKDIQLQFLKRSISKEYIALLDGYLSKPSGKISLPLRGDLYDRPRQIVCFEHGKESITEYRIIDHQDRSTKVAFYPITGRTHQLRVHAAHNLGLAIPIVGDDLYGVAADRLYLHAHSITLKHPFRHTSIRISAPSPF